MTPPATDKDVYHHGDLRAALIAAAEAELATSGMEKFSLRGCARRAGVSHAAPAHHFRTADALLAEVAAIGFARLTQAMTERMSAHDAPAERLIASGEGYVAFATANPALFKLMFSSDRPDIAAEPMATPAAAAFEILRSSVEAAAPERGSSPERRPIDIAGAWSVVHGLSHLIIEGIPLFPADLSADQRQAMIGAIIRRALPPVP